MTDLQIALIVLGVVLVLGVWAFNVWQEKRLRRKAAASAASTATAPASQAMAERTEPAFGDAPADTPPADEIAVPPAPTFAADAPAADPDGMASVLPAILPAAPTGALTCGLATPPLPAEWADGAADALLLIEFTEAQAVAALWAEQASWSAAIDKPLQWLALESPLARWRVLQAEDNGTALQLAVALQLTDRRGPVGEQTLLDFLAGVHGLAKRFAGLVELPEMAVLLERARALDGFCAAVDVQLSLLVVPRNGSLTEMFGGKLLPLFDAARLRAEGERFVAVDGGGAEAFAVVCRGSDGQPVALPDHALASLDFLLDVPRVAQGAAVFDRMLALAQQTAEALGGQLVDAHRNPLPDAKLAAIRARIDALQVQMAAAAMAPGSVRALRLFA